MRISLLHFWSSTGRCLVLVSEMFLGWGGRGTRTSKVGGFDFLLFKDNAVSGSGTMKQFMDRSII